MRIPRLPREVRRTIRAFLVLAVPIAAVIILVMGLADMTPNWAFKSANRENFCCCDHYRR
jgi:TRAP-type C4-dicarboxylate transport system permease small subunit